MSEFAIPITAQAEKFQRHLDIPGNSRILFSAPFGTGKTYFLQKFFGNIDQEKRYIPIHLFPVNYAISSNEDIFDLLRYDLFLHILAKGVKLKKEELSFGAAALAWWWNESGNTPSRFARGSVSLLGLIPGFGPPVDKVVAGLKELVTEIDSYRKEGSLDEGAIVNDLVKRVEGSNNTYNSDPFSILITSLIDSLKSGTNENEKREIVLIIDDLDRIDPDHLFRLLNVFSAHLDLNYQNSSNDTPTNKFGIDRVVFVCDHKNIASIFHHKYGSTTDINGYLDKFFTSEIFEFDHREYLAGEVINLLSGLSFEKCNIPDFSNMIGNETYLVNQMIRFVLTCFVFEKKVNTRRLEHMRMTSFKFTCPKFAGRKTELRNVTSFAIVAEFLFWIFGNPEAFQKALGDMCNRMETNHLMIFSDSDKLSLVECLTGHLTTNAMSGFFDIQGEKYYSDHSILHANGQITYFKLMSIQRFTGGKSERMDSFTNQELLRFIQRAIVNYLPYRG